MVDHSSCCGGKHDKPAGKRSADEFPIDPVGVISQTIAINASRIRWRVLSDVVDQRARDLHARSSYDCWNGLSETDQELWRHMARLELDNT